MKPGWPSGQIGLGTPGSCAQVSDRREGKAPQEAQADGSSARARRGALQVAMGMVVKLVVCARDARRTSTAKGQFPEQHPASPGTRWDGALHLHTVSRATSLGPPTFLCSFAVSTAPPFSCLLSIILSKEEKMIQRRHAFIVLAALCFPRWHERLCVLPYRW